MTQYTTVRASMRGLASDLRLAVQGLTVAVRPIAWLTLALLILLVITLVPLNILLWRVAL